MKTCSKCRIKKELKQFYKCKSSKDHFQWQCIECQKQYKKQHRKIYLEIEKQYNKKWNSGKGKESRKKYSNTPKGRFTSYKRNAKVSHRLFELSFNFASQLFLSNCFYCNSTPEPMNGIDRIDNNLGYTENNCVSCCEQCNKMKSGYSKKEWIRQCIKIVSYIQQKEGDEIEHFKTVIQKDQSRSSSYP